jgi:hypothetical protein
MPSVVAHAPHVVVTVVPMVPSPPMMPAMAIMPSVAYAPHVVVVVTAVDLGRLRLRRCARRAGRRGSRGRGRYCRCGRATARRGGCGAATRRGRSRGATCAATARLLGESRPSKQCRCKYGDREFSEHNYSSLHSWHYYGVKSTGAGAKLVASRSARMNEC